MGVIIKTNTSNYEQVVSLKNEIIPNTEPFNMNYLATEIKK